MRVRVSRVRVYGAAAEHSAPHGVIRGILLKMVCPEHLMVQPDRGPPWRSQHPIVFVDKAPDKAPRIAEVWCATSFVGSPLELVAAAKKGRAVVEVYHVHFEGPAEPSSRTPPSRASRRRLLTPESARGRRRARP